MKNKSPFSFRTSFTNAILASEKVGDKKEFQTSNASLKNLQSLLPQNINKDTELLYTFFNGAVANRFNLNDDGIDGRSAVEIAKYFINKPTNLDHQKKDVVGHIINFGFSSFDFDNKILFEEEAKNLSAPFNMSFSAVVYKNVDSEFAEMLGNSSNENSENYNKISTSWEIGFNNFYIAIGKSRNLNECQIISDSDEMGKYIRYLKAFGGTGKMSDGRLVMRLIVGDIYPLGFGYTMSPAAEVRGVSTIDFDDEIEEVAASLDKIEIENNYQAEKKQSHDTENHVNQKETEINMNINELTDWLTKQSKESTTFSQEVAANLAKTISDEVASKSKEYSDEIAKEKEAKAEIEKAKIELEAKVKELSEKSEAIEKELKTFKDAEVARSSEATFNGRMEEIDSLYDFDKYEKAIVAKEISVLANTKESFDEFKTRAAILYKKQSKSFKEEENKRIEKLVQDKVNEQLKKEEKSVEASKKPVEDTVKEALASLKPEDPKIPNALATNPSEKEDLFSSFMRALESDKKIKTSIK
jgi:hypothetical protein